MRDEQLKYILERKINLNECVEVRKNHIYYIEKPIRQSYNKEDGRIGYSTDTYEFLIIAKNGEKQGIILRCGYTDLHWYVLKNWRNKHVLSDALRTGIINEVWPENESVSCCYNYYDNREIKYSMTCHLAEIANLRMKN